VAADQCEVLCLDLEVAERLRSSQPSEELLRAGANQAQALGDPTRLRVAMALAGAEELCVCDVAWIVGRAQNLVSHHLRALREGGLAISRRDGKMALYELTSEGRALVASLVPTAAGAVR
jgi:DNA-binding transcriptional ArsR family regulator